MFGGIFLSTLASVSWEATAMPRLCPLQPGDLLGGSQAGNDGGDQSMAGGGLTRVGVPGQAGCVVLREMLSPGQLRWLLEMGSDGGKWFLFVLFFSLSSILSASGGSSWTLDETDLPP